MTAACCSEMLGEIMCCCDITEHMKQRHHCLYSICSVSVIHLEITGLKTNSTNRHLYFVQTQVKNKDAKSSVIKASILYLRLYLVCSGSLSSFLERDLCIFFSFPWNSSGSVRQSEQLQMLLQLDLT